MTHLRLAVALAAIVWLASSAPLMATEMIIGSPDGTTVIVPAEPAPAAPPAPIAPEIEVQQRGVVPYPMASPQATPPYPTLQRQDGVSFVVGGAGQSEQQAIRALAGDFNVKIATTLPNGQYVGDAAITIKDATSSATVLQTQLDGPLLYAQLPPGRYDIVASARGQTVTRTIRAGSSAQPEMTIQFGGAPATTELLPVKPPPVYVAGSGTAEPVPTPTEAQGHVSLYNLDPNAADAQAEVNYYEIYPDGESRRIERPARPMPGPDSRSRIIIEVDEVEPGMGDDSM